MTKVLTEYPFCLVDCFGTSVAGRGVYSAILAFLLIYTDKYEYRGNKNLLVTVQTYLLAKKDAPGELR